jgi:serine/threonine-protein kinase
LAKDKTARFQSASEFRSALTAAVGGKAVSFFEDGSQPATAPLNPISEDIHDHTGNSKEIPVSDPFAELLDSANEDATNPVTRVETTSAEPTQVLENGFSLLGFESGDSEDLEETTVVTKVRSDKPSSGWLWGAGSGATVLVVGFIIWLLAGGAALISFGGDTGTKILVSDVVGKTYEEAFTTLTNQELLVEKQLQISETVEAGTVISTDPPAGTEVGAKTTITVLVSSGKSLSLMPDLAGMTEQDAILAITNAKLVLGTITQSDSPTVAKNLVLSTDPVANTQIPEGTVVNLVLSTGSVLVPNIVNLELSDAKSQLMAPAVGYTVETQIDVTCLGTAGTTVIAQSIAPGIAPQLQTILLTMECLP